MSSVKGRLKAGLNLQGDIPVPADFVCRYLQARYEALSGDQARLKGMLVAELRESLAETLSAESQASPCLQRQPGKIQFTVVDIQASAREDFLTLQVLEHYRYAVDGEHGSEPASGLRRHIIDLRRKNDWQVANHSIHLMSAAELRGGAYDRYINTAGEGGEDSRQVNEQGLPWGRISLIMVGMVVVLLLAAAVFGPRRQQVDICLYRGVERYESQFCGFTWRQGVRETDLSQWVLGVGESLEAELWRPWGGYHKPSFGKAREISRNHEARDAMELLETIRGASRHDAALAADWLARYWRSITLMDEANRYGTVEGAATYRRAVELRQALHQELSGSRP